MLRLKLFTLSFVVSIVFLFTVNGNCEFEIHDGIDFKIYKDRTLLDKLPGVLFENPAKNHFFVNFKDDDYEKHHQYLEASQLEIIDYIPQNTYLVNSKLSISK